MSKGVRLVFCALVYPVSDSLEGAPTAVSGPGPYSLVFADTTGTAVFEPVPLSLVLADAATNAVYGRTPPPLVLADAATNNTYFNQ